KGAPCACTCTKARLEVVEVERQLGLLGEHVADSTPIRFRSGSVACYLEPCSASRVLQPPSEIGTANGRNSGCVLRRYAGRDHLGVAVSNDPSRRRELKGLSGTHERSEGPIAVAAR